LTFREGALHAAEARLRWRSADQVAFMAARVFSGKNATERSRTPMASNTVFETAADTIAEAALL
jgi:hypothetical protein